MSYSSVGWEATSLLSAENFNQMETQYSSAKADIDLHGHAGNYLKASSDAKFYPIASGLDADTIDSSHMSDIAGSLLPVGAIWIYEGSDDDFSSGYLIADPKWHQCDGSTVGEIVCPDTRGYFPKCPNTAATTGDGGTATQTLTGTVTIANHMLIAAEMPVHSHLFSDVYYTNAINTIFYAGPDLQGPRGATTEVARTTELNHAAADEAHNHGTKSVSFTAINLTPLHRNNWFIIKVA